MDSKQDRNQSQDKPMELHELDQKYTSIQMMQFEEGSD